MTTTHLPILAAKLQPSCAKFVSFIVLISMLYSARADAAETLQNPSFEASDDTGAIAIKGWETLANGHVAALDASIKQAGETSLKISSGKKPRGTIVQQKVDASALSERGLQLSGQIKTDAVQGTATLFAIVESKVGKIFLNDMSDRLVRGTSEWAGYLIVIPPLPDAESITLGALLYGSGTAWFDAFALKPLEYPGETSRQARDYLDAALDLMEQRSINRRKIDWSEFRERAMFVAKGAKAPSDTYAAIRYAVKRLGDRHSSFVAPTEGEDERSPEWSTSRQSFRPSLTCYRPRNLRLRCSRRAIQPVPEKP